MATIHGTITGVHGITTPGGPKMNAAKTASVYSFFVTATFSGTYAQANDADLLLVPTAIEAFMHDGRTYTILQAAFASPGDEAGTPIGAKACTVSSTTISFELTGGDLSTEHAGATLGAMGAPIHFFVTATAVEPA